MSFFSFCLFSCFAQILVFLPSRRETREGPWPYSRWTGEDNLSLRRTRFDGPQSLFFSLLLFLGLRRRIVCGRAFSKFWDPVLSEDANMKPSATVIPRICEAKSLGGHLYPCPLKHLGWRLLSAFFFFPAPSNFASRLWRIEIQSRRLKNSRRKPTRDSISAGSEPMAVSHGGGSRLVFGLWPFRDLGGAAVVLAGTPPAGV